LICWCWLPVVGIFAFGFGWWLNHKRNVARDRTFDRYEKTMNAWIKRIEEESIDE
jgi:hypothetical protein